MIRTPSRLPVLAVAAAVALALPACGADGDDEAAAPTTTAAPAAAAACDVIEIADPWVRAPAGPNTAAYFGLRNTGDEVATVVGVDTTIGGHTELHESVMTDGKMSMHALDPQEIAVPAGGEVALEPGGLHVMVMDVDPALTAGQTVALTVRFEDGCTVTIDAPVADASPGMEG